MSGSLRSLLLLPLIAIGVPAIAADPAQAQEIARFNLRPTFITPAAPVVKAPKAVAQTPPAGSFGWEIEVHTGAGSSHASAGTLTLPAAGATFLTFSGFETRTVRSWYFGDGAGMINAHLASVGITSRITSLDAILRPSSVKPAAMSPFGLRVSRPLTPRIGAEFSFEMIGALGFTDAARSAAEATRSSFQSVFNARFSTQSNRSVTSALTMADGARQMLATGALTINLRRAGRMMPYAVVGAGLVFATGDSPTIALDGNYQFVSASNTPYRQTDTINVRYDSGTGFAVLAGGGVKWHLNSRSGLRFDFRAHFASDPGTVVINWDPATIAGTPTNTIAFVGTPAFQISTANPSSSSLSLEQANPDLVVSTGSGMRQLAQFTVGYFYRFSAAAPVRRQSSAQAERRWDENRKWEVEGHGGSLIGSQASGGTRISAFPVGQAFTATSGQPSRYASSWMFGDGAVLINTIASRFTGITVPDRMNALDPVLTGPSLDRSAGGSGGARVSRRLTSRISAEFAVDAGAPSLSFSQAASNQIELTRASFAPLWNGLIATGGGVIFTNPNTSATAAVSGPTRNMQTSLTGGLEVRLWSNARLVTYATGGAGIIKRSATLPEATITGNYGFLFAGVAPLAEQDVVRVHYAIKQTAPVFSFGGGVKYFMTSRYGLRVDARFHVSSNSMDTLVDATPSFVPGTPTFSIPSTTNPALVFSNSSAVRGNLTGPVVTNLKTFTGSGRDVQTSLTVGYFLRF